MLPDGGRSTRVKIGMLAIQPNNPDSSMNKFYSK